jgi:release factor glutamine methyltransferase
MPSSSKKVFFGDYVFHVTENVYEPAEDSFLFAENLPVGTGDRVVDMGTGCGILGVIAATKADEVVAVDINPYAVRCAKENAELNHVAEKMSFVQGDLFSSIRTGERFDLVLFNAPYLPSDDEDEDSWLARSWTGGVSGRNVIDRFISGAPKHLEPNGEILLVQSTLSDVEETLSRFAGSRLRAEVVASQILPLFEQIVLIRAKSLQIKNDVGLG